MEHGNKFSKITIFLILKDNYEQTFFWHSVLTKLAASSEVKNFTCLFNFSISLTFLDSTSWAVWSKNCKQQYTVYIINNTTVLFTQLNSKCIFTAQIVPWKWVVSKLSSRKKKFYLMFFIGWVIWCSRHTNFHSFQLRRLPVDCLWFLWSWNVERQSS